MKRQKKLLLAAVILIAVAILCVFLLFPGMQIQGIYVFQQLNGMAQTPYGEYIQIQLGTSAQTSQASWVGAVASASQNVWTVNGTYKSQALVTLGYSLQVVYANVHNIKIDNLYIKAVDSADSSSYTYTLANNKALSGSSPISDSGSTQKSISQHLADCQASTSSATIKYYIYCKVSATGSISGQSLIAEITETWFCTLVYQQSTESAQSTVTPTVSVSSWIEDVQNLKPEDWALIVVVVLVCVTAVYTFLKRHKKKGGRRK